MSVLPISIYPDPVLRVRCSEVTDFDEGLRKLAGDMVETMHSAVGVGLAASQVGIEIRLIVVDASAGEDPGAVMTLVNPAIADPEGRLEMAGEVEGCLSIPGFTEKVDRPLEIRVKAQDLDGAKLEFAADELLARVICHEVDHLNGVLFVDHLRGLRKDKARRHLQRMKADAAAAATGT
ncbi:MAG: peptide deformylase [Thermoanaerobaculia bacterium]